MIFDLLKRYRGLRLLTLLSLSALGFLVMGYHPGAEDDGIYLTAVKAQLNPALFSHDAAFFQLQMRTSVFDTWMAYFVRGSGMSLAWAELLWQAISIFLILWASWRIVCQLFEEAPARWAGVAMVAAMFTLPVSGTALYILDQHLHPRGIATALILWSVERILVGKRWQALPLLVVGFLLHPLMGALGIAFCFTLSFTLFEPLHAQIRVLRERRIEQVAAPVAALIPLGWIFDPPSQTWLDLLHQRHLYLLYQWEWYEWLGAIGPLVLFALTAWFARRRGETKLSRFAAAIFIYGAVIQIFSMVILSPLAPVGLSTLEPMRYLHLVYIFLALVGGAYLGKYLLKDRAWRWALLLLAANGGMFIAQRELFAETTAIELPSSQPGNPWLQSFDWIRHNTPEDAYFVLDPYYMASPGEDYHSFRALAERSQLADANKDTAVVTKQAELAPVWKKQVDAQAGWAHFQLADFERLKAQFGVNWALVADPATAGLDCQWHNGTLAVCRIP
jgi:hypothetical protein